MLNQVEMLAVSKAIKDKDIKWAREYVVPGTFPVDVTVRLTGDVVVREDTTKQATSHLLSEEFLILCLKIAGCTRDHAMRIMEQVCDTYLQDWTGSALDREQAKAARQQLLKQYDPVGEIASMLAAMKERLPRVPMRGSVSFKGTVDVIEEVVEPVAKQVA